jgi:AcrR family transcriptional regulator
MDSPAESPAPRRTRRREARPAEVIEAARDLFIERGFAATKLEDVARRAGVSVGLPYVYFQNKEGLFRAVLRHAVVSRIQMGEETLDSFSGPTGDLLREMVQAYHEMNDGPAGGILKLVIAESTNFPDLARYYVEEVVVRGRRFFERLLLRGIERGEFRSVEVAPMARVLAAPLSLMSIWTHSLGPHDNDPAATTDSYLDAYLDLVLAGLRAGVQTGDPDGSLAEIPP